jgi:myo-inositol-1-phosphate synthase
MSQKKTQAKSRNGASKSGRARGRPGKTVRVAIAGVGNCASSLIQGVSFYRETKGNSVPDGLMHPVLGGYHIRDIVFSAAFDVNATKVGKDLSEAIFAEPNNTCKFTGVAPLGLRVLRGPTLDGIGPHAKDVIRESHSSVVDVARTLRDSGTDVLVSYLPVGSQRASEFYANAAIEAGCAFVNCIPVFIASEPAWRRKFEKANLPIIGDDIKSQLGATIVHRILADLFHERGVRLDRTYQLNFGGNMDFLNMLDAERLRSKKISKTRAVMSRLNGSPLGQQDVHIGPSDYVPWLGDKKTCYIKLEGTSFGNLPLNCEIKLEVWDSPNSAGIVIDAVRCAKLALDRGIGGALVPASSYFMKSPPAELHEKDARSQLEAFIAGEDAPKSTDSEHFPH